MNNTLYVIGNGFDLHHHLKTSYLDFAIYIKIHNRQLYNTLEEYIGYSPNEKSLWSKFEENLARLNVKEILSEHSDRLPDYANDEFRDRDRYVFQDIMTGYYEQLTTDLIESFENFIREISFPRSAFDNKLSLDINAAYLNFNYTNTLEKLYGIPSKSINYIHNSINGKAPIILGHGIDPGSLRQMIPDPPDNLTDDELFQWYKENRPAGDYSYEEGKEALMKYFEFTHKSTQKIIADNKYFFQSLGNIEIVYILGHSLQSVDLPYFKELVKSVRPTAKWLVSYYEPSDKAIFSNTLKNLGILEINIELIEMEDIQQTNKQLKMSI